MDLGQSELYKQNGEKEDISTEICKKIQDKNASEKQSA